MKYKIGSRLLKAPKSNRSTMPTKSRELRPSESGLIIGDAPDGLVVHRIKNGCHCNSHAASGKDSGYVIGDVKIGNFHERSAVTLFEQCKVGITSIYCKSKEEKNQHGDDAAIGKLALLAADETLKNQRDGGGVEFAGATRDITEIGCHQQRASGMKGDDKLRNRSHPICPSDRAAQYKSMHLRQ